MAAELPEHPGRVVARLARQVELAAATVELTLSQYRVLGILGDGREAASVLADKLAVSRPSVTGVIDGLVARGLVRRDPDETDRRRIDLGLTDDGRRVLARADAGPRWPATPSPEPTIRSPVSGRGAPRSMRTGLLATPAGWRRAPGERR